MLYNIISSSIKFALFVGIYEVVSHVLFHCCSLFFPTKCNNLVAYCGLLFLPYMSYEMTKRIKIDITLSMHMSRGHNIKRYLCWRPQVHLYHPIVNLFCDGSMTNDWCYYYHVCRPFSGLTLHTIFVCLFVCLFLSFFLSFAKVLPC